MIKDALSKWTNDMRQTDSNNPATTTTTTTKQIKEEVKPVEGVTELEELEDAKPIPGQGEFEEIQ